jgi:hypothetical protein
MQNHNNKKEHLAMVIKRNIKTMTIRKAKSLHVKDVLAIEWFKLGSASNARPPTHLLRKM